MSNEIHPKNIVLAYIPYKDTLFLNKRINPPYEGTWAFVGGHKEKTRLDVHKIKTRKHGK